MSIITQIYEALTAIVTGWVGVISDLFEGVVELFYTTGAEGGELTFVGVMVLVGVGIGLFTFGFNFIRRLVKMRG